MLVAVVLRVVMRAVTVMVMGVAVVTEMVRVTVMDGDGIGGVHGGAVEWEVVILVISKWMSFLCPVPHSGSQTAAAHLSGQCLFDFLVAVYPGHLFEYLERSVWFAFHN